jgi:hypothetical protein
VQAREMNDFHGSRLFPADQFSTMEVVEKLEYNGEQAYKVKMVRKSGNESIQYFSVASGLLIGAEVTQESQMGAMTVQMKFSEYQQQDGLKFPTKTEVTIGPNSIFTTVKSTTFNTVPPNTFEVPAAIKPLIDK